MYLRNMRTSRSTFLVTSRMLVLMFKQNALIARNGTTFFGLRDLVCDFEKAQSRLIDSAPDVALLEHEQ